MSESKADRNEPAERVFVNWLDQTNEQRGRWPRPGERVWLASGRTGIVDTAHGPKLTVLLEAKRDG